MKTHLIHPVSALVGATVILGACLLSGMQSPAGMNDEKRDILRHMTIVWLDDGQGGLAKTIRFTGVNVQVVNGLKSTNGFPFDPDSVDPLDTVVNSVGNLIVGYNELGNLFGDNRTGSHNIVVGHGNNYTSFGGFVGARDNMTSGPFASVTGGRWNRASGLAASVSGGYYNTASATGSSVSGGGVQHGQRYLLLGQRRELQHGQRQLLLGQRRELQHGQRVALLGQRRSQPLRLRPRQLARREVLLEQLRPSVRCSGRRTDHRAGGPRASVGPAS